MEYRRSHHPKGSLFFIIYGTPIGKGMPRVVRDKNGNQHAFKPTATREWESSIAGQAYKYKPNVPFNEPVALGCLFFRPMPAYLDKSKAKRQQALSFQIVPDKKPDLKNMIASVEDALEGAFWINDSSIVQYIPVNGLATGKYYSETPRVEILIIPTRLL